MSDPREEAFWSAVFRDLLPSAMASVAIERGATHAEHAENVAQRVATFADAALTEWRRRRWAK